MQYVLFTAPLYLLDLDHRRRTRMGLETAMQYVLFTTLLYLLDLEFLDLENAMQ